MVVFLDTSFLSFQRVNSAIYDPGRPKRTGNKSTLGVSKIILIFKTIK
jgi:hypothetical protein